MIHLHTLRQTPLVLVLVSAPPFPALTFSGRGATSPGVAEPIPLVRPEKTDNHHVRTGLCLILFATKSDWYRVKIPKPSLADLRLKGDRLRLLGEGRDCRRGDRDRRLSGERLTLRRAGLVSYDLPVPSTRERFLKEAEIFHYQSERRVRKICLVLLC